MSVTEQELSIAEAFGRLAARTGKGTRACPYEANGGEDQRVLSARFIHAYFEHGGTSAVGDDDQGDELAAPGNGAAAAGVVALGIATGAAAAYAWHRNTARRLR